MKNFLFFFLIIITQLSCSKTPDPIDYVRVTGDTIRGSRIAWDYSSLQQIAPLGNREIFWAGYPRVKCLSNGTHCAVYEADGNTEMIITNDEGKTWSPPQIVISKFQPENPGKTTEVYATNPEFIELKNGDWLVSVGYRPQADGITNFSIAVKRSTNKGATWSDVNIVYSAGTAFRNGCWEPVFLQLPDGTVQLYFANEGPYTSTSEQEISMISSSDNGVTWGNLKTISFREGRRDGMPVPALLNNEIVLAIEDNKVGQFKPYTVRTKLNDNWSNSVLADSPDREYALKTKLADNVYAGAPYLLVLPSGETLLSYQTDKNRNPDPNLTTVEVAVGDKSARNFMYPTTPFNVPEDRTAQWSSIALWDENTVVSATSATFKTNNISSWLILGYIIPETTIANRADNIQIDGNIPEEEWGDHFPFFVGHKSETNVYTSVKYDDENLYIAAKVYDKFLHNDGGDITKTDGITFLIDKGNYKLSEPDAGIYKIWCSYKGRTVVHEGDKGEWQQKEINSIIAMSGANGNDGYSIELKVPFSAINKDDRNPIRFNMELQEYFTSYNRYIESIVHTKTTSSNTWCLIDLDEE